MRVLYTLFVFFLIASSFAEELRSGDVILQSFDCRRCRLIQSESNSPWNHVGVVVKDQNGDIKIAESFTGVALIDPSLYLARGSLNVLFRSKDLLHLYENPDAFLQFEKELTELYYEKFQGSSYDTAFLWDNWGSNGRETLYCSEFVTKILNPFLREAIVPYPMSFKKNYEAWRVVFKGNVPEGLPRVGPVYFSRSNLFVEVGQL